MKTSVFSTRQPGRLNTPRTFRAIGACWLMLAMLALAGISTAHAAVTTVPKLVNYQGKLTDGTGANVANGNYEILFRIWSAASGGTLVWGQTYPVHIQDGYFNVILGDGGTATTGASTTDISLAFQDPNRFLGITMTKDATGANVVQQEIVPRQQFLSAPFALRTASAIQADRISTFEPDDLYKSAGGIISGNVAVTGTLRVDRTSLFNEAVLVDDDLIVSKSLVVKSGDTPVFTVTDQGVVNGGLVPVGGIIMWSGGTVPSGWRLCDGQNNTPDLRNKFIMGSSSTRSIGATGGNESITLSVGQLPPHRHSVTDEYFFEISNDWRGGGQASPSNGTGTNTSERRDTSDVGNGDSINILPPFYALAFIQRKQ